MEFLEIAQAIEATALGAWVRETSSVAPLLSAVHLVGLTVLFGTLLVVDLRLIGVTTTSRPITRVTAELLKWTWIAFALALISGALMILANATTYYHNTLLQVKLVLLLLAGINMFVFERFTMKDVANWDVNVAPSWSARFAGAGSLTLWLCIIFVGRWIGYTKSAPVPEVALDALGGFL